MIQVLAERIIAFAMCARQHVLQGLFSSPHFQQPNGTTFFLLYSKLQLVSQRLWSFQKSALAQSGFSNHTLSAVQSFNIHCITSSRRASNPSGSSACSFYKRAIKFSSSIVPAAFSSSYLLTLSYQNLLKNSCLNANAPKYDAKSSSTTSRMHYFTLIRYFIAVFK
jgi:hypothetical protein